jgi:hypothetical protein
LITGTLGLLMLASRFTAARMDGGDWSQYRRPD